jgi:hypothetical protein
LMRLVLKLRIELDDWSGRREESVKGSIDSQLKLKRMLGNDRYCTVYGTLLI